MNENREPYSYSFEPVDHDSRMQMNGGNAFTPPEAPKPKKGSHGAKIVAVAVACALVGGVGLTVALAAAIQVGAVDLDHVHALVPGQPGGLGDPVVGVEAVDEEQAGGGHPCS